MTAEDELARMFDEVAERYDAARPTYPERLFDDLVAVPALRPSDRILEIGCGTGQATRPLAQRRLEVTCVEMGERLAEVARRKLQAYANVEVVTGRFEDLPRPTEGFGAVVAFTSFHWVDPAVRYEKAAAVLRGDGILAVVSTHHVLPSDGDLFFSDVQTDYEAILPDDAATLRGGPVDPDEIEGLGDEISASALFEMVESRRYRWDVVYTAEEYLRLLGTYSNHLAFPVEVRRALFDRISARIRSRPGMHVRKSYLAILDIARVSSVKEQHG